MATKGKTGQVTALNNKWPALKQPLANAAVKEGKLTKDSTNKDLYDSLSKVIKAAVADLYNTTQTDPRLVSIVRTIIAYVNGAVKQQIEDNSAIQDIVDNTSKDAISTIVEKAVDIAIKQNVTSKDQTNKLADAIAKSVVKAISASKDKEKHDKLLADIKSMLEQQTSNTTSSNKIATKTSTAKSSTTNLKSINDVLKKLMKICDNMQKLQTNIGKNTNFIVKKLDATHIISTKMMKQVEQTTKIQQQIQTTTIEGFKNTNDNIEKVNNAVEEANENIKNIQSGSMLSGVLGGSVGLAFKALGFIGKLVLAPAKFLFKWILKPIFGFVGGAIGGLLKGIGSLIAAPFKLLMKGIGKVADIVTNVATKSLGTFFMTPTGMYTLGFIGGFIWEMWLKNILIEIGDFFKDLPIMESINSILEKVYRFLDDPMWNTLRKIDWKYIAEKIDEIHAVVNPKSFYEKKIENMKKIAKEGNKLRYDAAIMDLSKIESVQKKDEYLYDTISPYIKDIEDLAAEVKIGITRRYDKALNEKGVDFVKSIGLLNDELNRLGINTQSLSTDESLYYIDQILSIFKNNNGDKEAIQERLGLYAPILNQLLEFDRQHNNITDRFSAEYIDMMNKRSALVKKLQDLANSKIDERKKELLEYHNMLEQANLADKVVPDDEFHYPIYAPEQLNFVANEEIENKVDNAIQKIENVQSDLTTLAEKTQDLTKDYSKYSGWTFIDGKWHYDGVEATKEQNDAVKTEVEEAKRRAASELPNIRLSTSRDMPRIAQDDFNSIANTALEAGIPSAIVDTKNSEILAKNIANYLSDAQQQINAMPADEQRTWQSKLMDIVMKIDEAVNKRSTQQNNYLFMEQPNQSLWNADRTQ